MTYLYEKVSLTTFMYLMGDDFSYDAKEIIYDYMLEECVDTDTPLEMDRVAVRCTFAEYSTLEDLLKEYDSIDDVTVINDGTNGKPVVILI